MTTLLRNTMKMMIWKIDHDDHVNEGDKLKYAIQHFCQPADLMRHDKNVKKMLLQNLTISLLCI